MRLQEMQSDTRPSCAGWRGRRWSHNQDRRPKRPLAGERRAAWKKTPYRIVDKPDLPGILLLLQRPEVVGDAMDVFLGQHGLPGRHIQRRRTLLRILDRRHLPVLDDLDDLFLGV